jgi:hypothetical protein
MNKILKSAAFVAVPLMVACGITAQADQWDKYTKVTVSQSIEVPGAVLPAGTYIFQLLDSPSDRHVVQVFNERKDHIFASVIAIPNYRLKPTGKTVLTFYEAPAGQPQPVRAWFYPGDNFGQEFVYPKHRNLSIAQNTSTTTTTPVPVAETPEPEVVQAAPTPEPAPVQVAPEPQPEVAANEPPPAPAPLPATPVMPQTASNVPLFAMLGLLSIGAALSVGAFAKRMG